MTRPSEESVSPLSRGRCFAFLLLHNILLLILQLLHFCISNSTSFAPASRSPQPFLSFSSFCCSGSSSFPSRHCTALHTSLSHLSHYFVAPAAFFSLQNSLRGVLLLSTPAHPISHVIRLLRQRLLHFKIHFAALCCSPHQVLRQQFFHFRSLCRSYCLSLVSAFP